MNMDKNQLYKTRIDFERDLERAKEDKRHYRIQLTVFYIILPILLGMWCVFYGDSVQGAIIGGVIVATVIAIAYAFLFFKPANARIQEAQKALDECARRGE